MADDPFAAIATPVSQGDPFAAIATPTTTPAVSKTPGELKASFSDRLTSNYDPGAAEFDERHPVLGKGVRALSSLGGTVLSLPSGIHHLIADAPTEEEKQEHKGALIPATSMFARPALIAERIAKPVEEAIDVYSDPKTRPSVKQAVSVSPEALGVGAGQYVGGELVGRSVGSLSKVGELRKSAAEKAQGFARKATGVETAVKESVGKAAEKHGEALTENAAKRTETVKNNLETQRAAESKIVRDKMAIGEKNKGIEAENAAQAADVAKRGELAKTVDEQSNQLHGHIAKVEASVAKEANAKFAAVREQIGIGDGNPGPEVPPDTLVATVHNVEEQTLQGIPENIKEFRAILKHEGIPENLADAVRTHAGFEPEGPAPLTWDKLQSLKSRIEARLRKSNGMNGDLKRGLYQTRDVVVDEMGKIAEGGGAGEMWDEAKGFWRQYKEDFHEPQGPSGSGSPVAQSLNAADPKNIRQPFLQKQATTGNRAVQILRKYPQHGGTEAASHAERLIQNHETMRGLPEKVSPKALKTYPEVHEMPASKPAPKIPENPTVDINKVSREKIAQVAKNWGSFNARDVGILGSSFAGEVVGSIFGHGFAGAILGPIGYESAKYAMSRTMNKPGVINWLAKTPPEEIAVLNKIPGADKVKLVDGITKLAIDSKATELSPSMKALLGARNVARIMAVSTPSVVKTPGEAKDRARQLANK